MSGAASTVRPEQNGSLAAYVAQFTDLEGLGKDWHQSRCPVCWDADKTLTIYPCDGEELFECVACKERGNAADLKALLSSSGGGRVLLGRIIREGIEPPAALVEDVLHKGKTHVIFGPAGYGKTFVLLWLVLEVLKRSLPVLIFDNENNKKIMAERLAAMGADPDTLDRLLHYHPFPELPTTDEGKAAFEVMLERIKPALVCFDSWISFLADNGLDENSSNDISTFSSHYLHPARRRDITTLVLDHVPHEGNHARGSTRKRDEVDVMWRLSRISPFDRECVGSIALNRVKDREGWLPESVVFSVGGTADGEFIFKRSAGTFEAEGEDGLKDSERKALQALEGFGESGAKAAQWEKAAEALGVKRRTFYNALNALKAKAAVLQENQRYFLPSASKCKSSAIHQNAPARDVGAKVQQPFRAAPIAPLGPPEDDYADIAEQLAADEEHSA